MAWVELTFEGLGVVQEVVALSFTELRFSVNPLSLSLSRTPSRVRNREDSPPIRQQWVGLTFEGLCVVQGAAALTLTEWRFSVKSQG